MTHFRYVYVHIKAPRFRPFPPPLTFTVARLLTLNTADEPHHPFSLSQTILFHPPSSTHTLCRESYFISHCSTDTYLTLSRNLRGIYHPLSSPHRKKLNRSSFMYTVTAPKIGGAIHHLPSESGRSLYPFACLLYTLSKDPVRLSTPWLFSCVYVSFVIPS